MRSIKSLACGLAVALGLLIGQAAIASPVPWTVPNGTTPDFDYFNGQSDNGLFGDPIISPSGYVFTFFPSNFKAVSTNGVAANTSDRLSFEILMKPGKVLTGFAVNEFGDYTITGTGSVSATGALFLTNLLTGDVVGDTLHTTPGMPITTNTFTSGNWTGTSSVSLLPNGWTKVKIVLNNVLQATSGANSAAQIEKKITQGIIITLIPEPGSIAMAVLGSGLLLIRRRK